MKICIKGIDSTNIVKDIFISGSKSESNRMLVLQKLFREITIHNLSDSDDTHHLQDALSSQDVEINVGHAGTAMRFLTAFFAIQQKRTTILSGSERMHQRPIKVLVEALRALGAEIYYLENEGFPPLKIIGKQLAKEQVKINGNISSQYISALLLIAASLPNGLRIELIGEITSIPYINMTLSLLNQIGITTSFKDQIIQVYPFEEAKKHTLEVESDWSSASYFYSIAALSSIGSEIRLSSYKKESLQGDAILANIYKSFGVETVYETNSIILRKTKEPSKEHLSIDLNKAPDIAQTIAVTCYGLGVSCELLGLHTLKIKETDRLEALHSELTKLGANISVTSNSLYLKSRSEIVADVSIETYNDHRMAMAFAPLGMKIPLEILDADVVTKSYRNFWKDLQKIGFQINKV
jgi:3-phosphoshikimate 1-carboxyvinyltransferase